jgi:hypothetical protein
MATHVETTSAGARSTSAHTTQAGSTDRNVQMWCAWCGPVAVVGAILGMVVLSGFIPAQSPSESGPTIAHWYATDTTTIRLGMVVSMIAFTLFVPFGIAICLQIRRTEIRPVMTYIQIACVAIAALEGVIACCIWVAAAFRPVGIDPNIVRALNDLGWIAFLLDVPPFTVWIGSIGIGILRDHRTDPVFPRWLGYLNLWVAALVCPALSIPFFKTGPLAYNGLIALYIPFGCFFVWMVITTPYLMRAIKSEAREAEPTPL